MTDTIDLNRLFKLRLIVARYGEMDGARWWNTDGVLGRKGSVLSSLRTVMSLCLMCLGDP